MLCAAPSGLTLTWGRDRRRGARVPPSPSDSAVTAVLTDPLQVNAAPSEPSANSSHSAVFLFLSVFSFKCPVCVFLSSNLGFSNVEI